MPSQVLIVCTGNICRSPVAARILDALTDPTVRVESAGTRALAGQPVDPAMIHLLRGAGFDVPDHRARTMTPAMVDTADLVVTMTRRQRATVVAMSPGAVSRAFTLLELARLLDGTSLSAPHGPDSDRVQRIPAVASARRDQVLDGRQHLDVPDPYGRASRQYEQCFATLLAATESIAGAVRSPGFPLPRRPPTHPAGRGAFVRLLDAVRRERPAPHHPRHQGPGSS